MQQILYFTDQLTLILVSVSFQEEDLNCVRERWSEALIKRREYLDEQIKKIINKHGEPPTALREVLFKKFAFLGLILSTILRTQRSQRRILSVRLG